MTSKIKEFNKIHTDITAINIDPEGLSGLEEFDPSGDFNPVQVYDSKFNGNIFRIVVPYETLENGGYIGFEIIDGNDISRRYFKGILK